MHGTMTSGTERVWICLHGYGQLGKYFIQRFEFLDPVKNLVIVPEGLNRYYAENMNDRPSANWMTREDRLDEIADYILFLEEIRKKLSWEKNQKCKIIYLGFSQGVSTLLRWLHDRHPRADYLLLWAGGIPDDISFEFSKTYFAGINAHCFVGEEDEYYRPEQMPALVSLLESTGMKADIHLFSGGHTVDEAELKNWLLSL